MLLSVCFKNRLFYRDDIIFYFIFVTLSLSHLFLDLTQVVFAEMFASVWYLILLSYWILYIFLKGFPQFLSSSFLFVYLIPSHIIFIVSCNLYNLSNCYLNPSLFFPASRYLFAYLCFDTFVSPYLYRCFFVSINLSFSKKLYLAFFHILSTFLLYFTYFLIDLFDYTKVFFSFQSNTSFLLLC
jgi:hypothetical protein